MAEENKGLDNTTIAFMIAVALFYDALQVLLAVVFMGWLVGIIAFLTFYVWFKMRGLNFTTPKRAVTLGAASVIEMFPFLPLSALPAWTAAITYLALDSKIKKNVPSVIQGAAKGKVLPFKQKVGEQSTEELKKAA